MDQHANNRCSDPEPVGDATGVTQSAPSAQTAQSAPRSVTSDLDRSVYRGENTVTHNHYHCCHSHSASTQGHLSSSPQPQAPLLLPQPVDSSAVLPPSHEDVTAPYVQRRMRREEQQTALRTRRVARLERELAAANARLAWLELSPDRRPSSPRRRSQSQPRCRQNNSVDRPRPVSPGSDHYGGQSRASRRRSRSASPAYNPGTGSRRNSSGQWEPMLVLSPMRNHTTQTDNQQDRQSTIAAIGSHPHWEVRRLPMGSGISPAEFLAQHHLTGATIASDSISQAPSLESLTPVGAATPQRNARTNVNRDWLTYGLTSAIVKLRKLFLGVLVEVRQETEHQGLFPVWKAVTSAIVDTGVFPSEERFDAAWRLAFQQSPYAHIRELLQMDIEEILAMLAALEGGNPPE